MISSFRLPDLVLGVSIRADTTGARQAAQQLKAAIGSQFGSAGGVGGGTAGGRFLGNLLGSGAGGLLGAAATRALLPAPKMKQLVATMTKTMTFEVEDGLKKSARQLKTKSSGLLPYPAPLGFRKKMGTPPTYNISNLAAGVGAGKAASAAAGAGAKAAAGSSGWWTNLGATFAGGHMMRGIKMAAKKFWPLLIVLLAYEFIKHVMVPAIKAATGYIRRSGATGYYGEYGRRISETPVLLKNVQVQFGLMAITLLDLLPIMESLNAGLMRLGTVFGWMAKHPAMIKSQLAGMGAIGAYLVALPYVMKFVAWATKWLPDTGGQDLGTGGRSPKLAGAMLEGSVEAYSTIRGTMQRYAADTARNTRETSETLKKILARGPEMGVVAG